ncbi:MAG: c-type cytochrome, partial [Pirellulaceae bacterium]|nr:c-type cytochrome [Pirellulaceae bacterium]
VFIMPAIIFAGIGLHLVFLMRHGVSEMPDPEKPVDPETYQEEYEERLEKTGVPFWPDAMWRDVVFSTFVVAGIVLCAALLGPPALSTPPDPSNIHSNPMPDWYFWWYFTVLSVLPSSMETWIILGAPVFGFLAVLLVPFISNKGHRAPGKRPWAVGVLVFGITSFVVLTIYGYYKPWSPDFGVDPLPESVIGATSGPIHEGGLLVHQKGCLYCHHIDGYGGHRGPVLSDIGQKLTREDITIRIMNGGYNMPSFAGSLSSDDLSNIVDFLLSRNPNQEITNE